MIRRQGDAGPRQVESAFRIHACAPGPAMTPSARCLSRRSRPWLGDRVPGGIHGVRARWTDERDAFGWGDGSTHHRAFGARGTEAATPRPADHIRLYGWQCFPAVT